MSERQWPQDTFLARKQREQMTSVEKRTFHVNRYEWISLAWSLATAAVTFKKTKAGIVAKFSDQSHFSLWENLHHQEFNKLPRMTSY